MIFVTIIRFIIVAWVLVAASSVSIHQTASAIAATIPMKTYSDFGLGFKMQIPSYLLVHRYADTVVLRNPPSFNDSSNHLTIASRVTPVSNYFMSIGSFTPNLDELAKHVGLYLASLYPILNETVTNKTKLVVGNGTSAYLFQSETGLNNTIANHGQKILYRSYYLMLNDNIVYSLQFATFNQTKFLPVEQQIMKSFRVI